MLSQDDDAGDLHMTQPGQPESWERLRSTARTLERAVIPATLWTIPRSRRTCPCLGLTRGRQMSPDMVLFRDRTATSCTSNQSMPHSTAGAGFILPASGF